MTIQKTVCAVCIATLFASGCATPGGSGTDASDDNKNTALRCAAFGAGGAILGALIGGRGGAVKGAVAGLAACAVVEIASRQTKSAAEVEKEYKTANRNQLPRYAKVDSYVTEVTPNGAVKPGEAIKVHSTIRAVSGTQEPIHEVKEELVAYAPSGEEFKRGEKRVNDVAGSGEYANSFTLTLPQGAPQGIYKLETKVYVNGKPVSRKQTSVQLAVADSPQVVALLGR